ncbi:RING finger protein 17 isoform X2 [Larimichthys crocea]|uniref:RING finger protein 17 isoform X2 n=1 Tax=Larimichthys crocea TaxID=215358 RepID=UPI000F600F39|nr:RING finger protein 17 isoform X2 [Larimichthys crocea]
MDRGDNSNAVVCNLCGEAFTLPEDEADGNLPRVLSCGHIYCTTCLLSIQYDSVIRCPECEVEFTVPEGGVYGLQEESRIIGLMYTAKMNKIRRCERLKTYRRKTFPPSPDMNANKGDMQQPADLKKIKKTVDEALCRGAENLAQLEHIYKTLTTGLAEQVKRERARLEMELKQAADKAVHAVQKWKDVQLKQLSKLEAQFSTTQVVVCCVRERIKALKISMQMAKEICRVPFLEQHCTLDKVLKTLQAPVDSRSFDMKCTNMDSGMSCVFQSEGLKQSLSLSLKMEEGNQKQCSPWRAESKNSNCTPPKPRCANTRKQAQKSPASHSLSSESSSPSPKPRHRFRISQHNATSNLQTPDVIVEHLEESQKHALPPTGPELANGRGRINRRRRCQVFDKSRSVTQWVVVAHIVNPNQFYVHYVTEKKENETLSRKINQFCYKDGSHFTASDTVETGSVVFVKWTDGLWCRANVLQMVEIGCVEDVKACPVDQLASIQVYFLDYGLTKSLIIQNDEATTESSLKAVNNHLRKVTEAMNMELGHFVPQAIRCSLKDLVPYDLTKGWSEEARAEFHNVVGSAAVEMRLLGQDGDSLLVDLRKAPMNQSSDVPISVREYLVFIEVARFYSPVTLGRKPLLYYPPVYPKINTEVDVVVSHINNPADFFIQLVHNMESLLLSAKLQECYSATETGGDHLRVYCPVMGQAYVARYDDKWYRAQVIGHPGGREVEVYYVDFGNKNILSVSDLRMIKDEFFALPSMAIHCCLSDVIPLDGESWSDACTKRLISLVYQKLVTIVATETVPKTKPLPIKLFESILDRPLSNIAELLVKEGLACFKRGLKSKDASLPGDESAVWDPPLEHSLATGDADAPDQKITGEQGEELLDVQPLLKLQTQLKDLKVKVSHVNSPSSFYVQLLQYNSQLKRVCELVKKECALTEPQDVAWKADMYCAAHMNGVWERGQISSDVTSSDIAELMRCDHGNTVKLHVCNLRTLPSSLMGSLALECTLSGIRPAGGRSTWTATACDLFSHYLTGASAVMTVKLTDERPVPVTLFCSNRTGQFVSIADFLTSEGLALRERKPRNADVHDPKESDAQSPARATQTECSDDGNTHPSPFLKPTPSPSSHTPPKPAPRTIMSAEKVTTKLYQPPELPCPGHIQISVSAIREDGLIYGRTENAECQLEQLRERIHQSIKTLPRPKSYTWKSVLGCAVIGPDMLWYRGQLLEVLGGHVKVQYVDYGLVENIPVVHVYPILLCEDVPQLCMPFQLHNVNPVGGKWQQDAVAMLREMLLNRSVDIDIMELPTDPRGPLTVELFLDGLSLSQILCHHEHATIDQTVSTPKRLMTPASLDDWDIDTEGLEGPQEPLLGPFIYPDLPQEGEHFPVRVKHLLTPTELFLWPQREGVADAEVDGETLDEALSRINANIDSLPQLNSFSCGDISSLLFPGGPCLAEYSDGNYYRAKLIRFISAEPIMVLVQHVDFGSDDTLPITKLREMPAELLRFPSRALKVKVAGFKAPSVRNRQEDMLPYSPEWSVKATMEMIDLLNGRIEATVVAREPELTVVLYNEDGELVHLPLVSSGLAELE